MWLKLLYTEMEPEQSKHAVVIAFALYLICTNNVVAEFLFNNGNYFTVLSAATFGHPERAWAHHTGGRQGPALRAPEPQDVLVSWWIIALISPSTISIA